MYLFALLLGAIICLLLLVNQFWTNKLAEEKQPVKAEPQETTRTEEKQPAAIKPKTAAPGEENTQASQTKEEKDVEEKAETEDKQDGYVADWFKPSDSSKNEEAPAASKDQTKDQTADQKKSGTVPAKPVKHDRAETPAETIENQSSKQVVEEQLVVEPVPPIKPEQPAFSPK